MLETRTKMGVVEANSKTPVVGQRLRPEEMDGGHLTLLGRVKKDRGFREIPSDRLFYLGPYYAGEAMDDQDGARTRTALRRVKQDKDRARELGVRIDGVLYEVKNSWLKTKLSHADMSDDVLVGVLGDPKA
ncbi:MAG: hypothetical protein Q8N98_02480 [bacterium]|nr:hypothetical protein [bacterium]